GRGAPNVADTLNEDTLNFEVSALLPEEDPMILRPGADQRWSPHDALRHSLRLETYLLPVGHG
ncbi:MAG: hypothetical protein ABJC09_17650, partial [Terriglobia bacterium]